MIRAFIFSTVLFFAVAQVHAQDFKVLASKGKVVSYPKGQPHSSKKLMSGHTIGNDEMIKLSNGAFVGLVHKNGKTMELKQSGTYTVQQLKQKARDASSATERYANYVYSELTKKEKEEHMSSNHRQYMSVTGSVERAINRPEAVKPIAPMRSDAFADGKVSFFWEAKEGDPTYVFTIVNLFEEEVFQEEVKENKITVDLGEIERKRQLLWKVQVKGQPNTKSDEHVLRILDEEKAKELKETFQAYAQSNEGAIGKVANATFFEQNHLYLHALEQYKTAMEMEPEVDDFKNFYNNFLTRVGLEEFKQENQ